MLMLMLVYFFALSIGYVSAGSSCAGSCCYCENCWQPGDPASGDESQYCPNNGCKHILPQFYPDDWPFLRHCLQPKSPGGLFDYELPQCADDDVKSKRKDDITPSSKIAIVGGGPGGILMAKLLSDRGFKDLTLFEAEGRLGGKAKEFRVENENGQDQVYDLGSCYTAGKYECVELLAEEVAMKEVKFPLNESAFFDSRAQFFDEPLSITQWSLDINVQKYSGMLPGFLQGAARSAARGFLGRYDNWPGFLQRAISDVSSRLLVRSIEKYQRLWQKTMGSGEYLFPSEEDVDFKKLNCSIFTWLDRHDLDTLAPLVQIALTAQGYGDLKSTPAFYGLMWVHPNLFERFRPGKSAIAMFRDGWQQFLERVLNTTSTSVRLNSPVTNIVRLADRVEISTPGNVEPEIFDWLVFAAPMPHNLRILSDPSPEELTLFSRYHFLEGFIQVVDSSWQGPMSDENAPSVYWVDLLEQPSNTHVANYDADTKSVVNEKLFTGNDNSSIGPWALRRDGMIKGHTDNLNYGVTLQIAPRGTSYDDLIAATKKLVTESNSSHEVITTQRWEHYGPSKSLQEIVEQRQPWRIWDLQGKQRTWFVGSSVSFESVADILDYNLKLVNSRLCSNKKQEACDTSTTRSSSRNQEDNSDDQKDQDSSVVQRVGVGADGDTVDHHHHHVSAKARSVSTARGALLPDEE